MAHHHHPTRYDRAFKIGIVLNILFVIVEGTAGFLANSVALISDAGHNLGDVVALALAWGGFWLSGSSPTERRTYGMKRATILASLTSAVLLCIALGAVIWEALTRLATPAPTHGAAIIVVAAVGVLVNGVTAAMFMSGRHSDLNIKGAFMHMAADAAVSLGVVIAGVIIYVTAWTWIDPVVALAVGVIILVSGVDLLRESFDLAMDSVPRNIDASAVRRYLEELPTVVNVHDLHIWAMSTTQTALTVHLVVTEERVDDNFLKSVSNRLQSEFSIEHPTIQLETTNQDGSCVFSGDDSVRTS